MAAKSAHDAARAKAAKQKKILVLLALPLLVAIFYAYHTITGLHHSSSEPVTPAAATTPGSSVPAGTTQSATAAAAAAPLVAPTPTGIDSLTLLAAKDPFHDAGPHVSASSSPNTGKLAGAGGGGGGKQKKTKPQVTAAPPAAPPTSAVIAVNGRVADVALGTIFPLTNNPATYGIFRLVGLTQKSAKVAVVGGSYASGAHTLTLRVNVAVTLVNTADGKRYTLVLYPQGSIAPGATTTTTTTTPGG